MIQSNASGRTARLAAAILTVAAAAAEAAPRDDTVLVASGTFRMGTPAAAIAGLRLRYAVDFPAAFDGEAPAHVVTLGAFRIATKSRTRASPSSLRAMRSGRKSA
jgi:formylglycine-generating enzyme required for sulfatase activity